MTVKDAIEATETLRPGMCLALEDYLGNLNRLESQIYNNIISLSRDVSDFNGLVSQDDALVLPSMYEAIYIHYLAAQIDIANGDITRYSNNMILFNNLLSSYADWYIRNHMPKQKGSLRWR